MKLIVIHTICSLLSYVAFLIAFVSGALFLIQDRQLKHKQMGLLFHRLPALGTLDRANFLAVGAGFALLTVGLLFGVWGSRRLLGSWWRWDPKELLTVTLWVMYLAVWLVRLRATLRGRKIAILSILSFALVLFTFVGVRHWLPTWHAYL